jgi:hypothetical protein
LKETQSANNYTFDTFDFDCAQKIFSYRTENTSSLSTFLNLNFILYTLYLVNGPGLINTPLSLKNLYPCKIMYTHYQHNSNYICLTAQTYIILRREINRRSRSFERSSNRNMITIITTEQQR